MSARRITFPGATAELAGRLHLPPGEPRALALFAHCFTCSKDLKAAVRIAESLALRDIGVLRFDFTGLGQSEGEFADSTFSSDVGDLTAAAAWLESELGRPVELLVGHSLGGAAVLAAAGEIDSVKAVATIGAPADPAHVEHLLVDASDEIRERGAAVVSIAGREFCVKQSFIDDIRSHALTDRVRELRCAKLICHAPLDNIVGIDNASALFVAAKHPKSFLSLDDADHLLSAEADALYAAEVIASWSERFAGGPRAEIEDVRVTTRDGFATEVRAGRHATRADEPARLGGTDTGPTPYDFLAAALGSCTSITLRMYADRKKWPVDQIEVTVRHRKIHASDCEECETTTGKVDVLEREIRLTGGLDGEQRRRMTEIADKCPVHKTLHSEIAVRTRLVE